MPLKDVKRFNFGSFFVIISLKNDKITNIKPLLLKTELDNAKFIISLQQLKRK